MGKKKKLSKLSTTAAIGNLDSLFDDEVSDVLASILERTDCKRSENIQLETRVSLCSSLRNLSAIIEKRTKSTTGKSDNIQEDFWLLQVERITSKVRTNCDNLNTTIRSERESTFVLVQKLESIGRKYTVPKVDKSIGVHVIQVTIFGRSLLSKYLGQLQMEERIVENVLFFLLQIYDVIDEKLSPLSSDGRTQNDALLLQKWIQCLEERIGLDQMQWNHLASIFMQMQDQQKLDLDRIKNASHSTTDIAYKSDAAIGENIEVTWRAASEISPASEVNERGQTKFQSAQTLQETVDNFLQDPNKLEDASIAHFVLVVGDSGNGKTYLCDEVEKKVASVNASKEKSCCRIIRPSLPMDLMGTKMGETEDLILSMFMACTRSLSKCILILDDVQHLLGNTYDAVSNENTTDVDLHTMLRTRSAFLSAVNSVKNIISRTDAPPFQLLIICTARNHGDETVHQFDSVFQIQNPDHNARKKIIVSSFRLTEDSLLTNKEIKPLVNELVVASLGKSHAELAQCCRETLRHTTLTETLPANTGGKRGNDPILDKIELLREMNRSLSSNPPESVRSGSLDDFVDIRVMTARDLLIKDELTIELPLFGKNAREAWNEMERLIVSPLCRAKALDDILCKDLSCTANTNGSQLVCAGVLLTGSPGSGKSALAYHCAKVAVSILPSLSLLDVSCTSLVHKEVGGSERALQRLFSAARAAAPCILLMDGIENIAGVRGHDTTTEGTMDRVLSTLLTELDGVDNDASELGTGNRNHVAVIGITHDPALVDPALRRPGRLEKTVFLGSPDYDARRHIILREIEKRKIAFATDEHTDNHPMNKNELSSFLASETSEMSAAEVVAVCNKACIVSSRRYINATEQQTSTITSLAMEVDDFIAAIGLHKSG